MSYSIAVIGTGYVGLVTGTCLADVGNQVLCVDVDVEKVELMRRGGVPIFEPGLDHLLERNIREGRIRFTTDLVEAVSTCGILMFCLPTPPGKDGEADLAAVEKVARDVANLIVELNIEEPRIIVNKSTVPVGTTERVAEIISSIAVRRDIDVVSNPEFLREGFAVEDFMKPDRVVVGTRSVYAESILRDLYEPFVRNGAPILVFDERSAEVAKYAANAFLAVKISFMNDLSEYCEKVGADIENIRISMGADERIGRRFLFAGIGYGGSCFPKDVKAIVHAARQAGAPLEILESTMNVNRNQVRRFVDRIRSRFDGNLSGRTIALWGLAFKPNTDDVREAPAFAVIDELINDGCTIRAYDPEAHTTTRRVYGDSIYYASSPFDACEGAEALVIATEWNEFANPDWSRIRAALTNSVIFDGRNMYQLDDMLAEGFEYHSIGRATVIPDTADPDV
ncbi:MAG TPA: UDP-glucose/GDP-mannose dehydrogenase family protein [Chlorobiota bacterium]|nr:UDP-glucose/GDP-mannose dehydrogenase family protein [Chlorobiota bacterium]